MPDTPQSHAAPEGLSARAYVRYPDLDGRHVFITGGGSGIGAYFVHAFATQGAKVSFVSLHTEAGEALCEAVAFPDAYRRRRRPFRVGDILPVAGRSTRQDGLAVLEVA